MGRTLKYAALIVLLGAALGLVGNQLSPRGLPLIAKPKPVPAASEFIPLKDANQLWKNGGAMFVDAREPADFHAGHIPNAFNLPVLSFAEHIPQLAPMIGPESKLILYCDGLECELSHRLGVKLRELGYTNSQILLNGWTAWRGAGYPMQAESKVP